ncbi:MAG TPA: DUF2993 domain-containing protein [Kribbella sp.]
MSSARPRRGLRALVIAVVVLACLGFIADRVAESLAEDRLAVLAKDEAARYEVRASSTTAEIGGFGFLPQLVRGQFASITLTMQRPTVSSIQAEDLTVAMSGVHVPRAVLTGGTGAVKVDSTDLRVRLSPDALTRLARSSGLNGLTLRIVGAKLQARLVIQGVEATATVRPQVQNGRIRLIVDGLPAALPSPVRDAVNSFLAKGFALPALPFGATLKQVTVDGQSVLLTATAANIELPAA